MCKLHFTVLIKILFIVLINISNSSYTQAQSDDTLQLFGESEKELIRPYKMIKLPDNHLVWVGAWNDQGLVMKITPSGKEVKKMILPVRSGAALRIKDVLLDQDQTIVVAGECFNCIGSDSTVSVSLYRIDADVQNILQQTILQGQNDSIPFLYNPIIARSDRALVLQATQSGRGDDFEDLYWAALDSKLDTLWSKTLNSCPDCVFENPYRMIATGNGFTSFVYHDFTDSASMYHFDHRGTILWKQRTYTWSGVAGGSIAARNDKIYIGVGVRGLPQDPFYYVATLLTFDEKTGVPLNATSFNDPFTDRAISSLEFSKNGNLLVGYRRLLATFNGFRLSSQVLRLDATNTSFKFIDSKIIPNPDENINLGILNALTLNDDGSQIVALGQYGISKAFIYATPEHTVALSEKVATSSSFEIYPNPVLENQNLYINLPNHHLNSLIKITIYDVQGRMVKTNSFTNHQGVLSIDGLAKGHYYIKATTDKESVSKKIIIR